jgi:hypothetical protein
MAGALPADETADVSAHVALCPTCTVAQHHSELLAAGLRAALELDQRERDYVVTLDLGGPWRTRRTSTADARWGWLALLGVVTAFLAWTAVAQQFGFAVGVANEVGVGSVVVTTALTLLFSASQALITLATNPALSFSQPLLAVLALALLFWPRITSAPKYFQGARS